LTSARGRHGRKLYLEALRLYLFELEEAATEMVFDDLDGGTAESVERGVMHGQHGVLEPLICLQVLDLDARIAHLVPVKA
jgi:hypothetical protein